MDIAQYALGKLYLSDDEQVRDTELGIWWLEEAAQNGNIHAAYRMGKECLKGTVIQKDVFAALEYLMFAAEHDQPHAQYLLGKLCLDGKDVQYDKDKAIFWFARAAGQGHDYAQFFVDRQDDLNAPAVMLSATRLLHHMSRIFQNNSLPKAAPAGMQVDKKLWRKLQEKRVAMGHKRDDHPDRTQGMTMSM